LPVTAPEQSAVFEGRTLRQAMRRAQEELGPGARMLDTHRQPDGSWRVQAAAGQGGAETGLPQAAQATSAPQSAESEAFIRDLRSEVAELRRLVTVMETGPVAEGEARLRKRGLSPGVARVLWRVESRGQPSERVVKLSGGLRGERGQVRAALVGPTGSGKTTTIAKLAARYVMAGKSVHLVGTDTFRIGALDQLQQYARIMDLPLSVARNSDELGRALKRAEGYDVVLVDTIGRGGRAQSEVAELAELFQGQDGLRRHLVLPANADIEDARASYQTFRCLEPASLLPTKLDETVRRARPLEIAVASGLPLSAFGCGQRVPEDFGYFSYAMIRRKLLGLANAGEGA
jgi:flagellar biosynthesis protein FlhF